MKLGEQPDFRISSEQVAVLVGVAGLQPLVVHKRAGCPKVAPIEVFDGYLRCSKCYNPLQPAARDTVLLLGSYDEGTNSFKA